MRNHLLAFLIPFLFTACFPLAVHAEDAPRATLSAILAEVIAPPNPVLGADDRVHLAYEIRLTNQSPLIVTLEEVEVLDGDGATVLARLGTEHLKQLYRSTVADGDPVIGGGQNGVLFMDVALPKTETLPKSLRHRFHIALSGMEGVPPEIVFTADATPVGQKPALVVAPPLRGKDWVAGGGCCATISSHRGAVLAIDGKSYVAERFAIDFVQVNDKGRIFDGPNDQLSSYPYFGVNIHAVAGGEVVATQDGLPEEVPGANPPGATLENAGGNYVIVDIGDGHYAFYAHMQPGSLKVKQGDKVKAGDVLGLLGNSGNSSAPHLHFHIMDALHPLKANGLPYRFTTFTGVGVAENEDALETEGGTVIDRNALAGPHQDQLPLNLQVIDFPD